MSARERYEQIMTLYHAGRYEAAEKDVATALRVSPQDANFLHLAGLIAESRNELPRAAMFMQRALLLRPNWFEAEYNLARVLSAQKKYADAINLMGQAALAQPKMPHVWEALANFCMLSGDLPAAVLHWQKALELVPQQREWQAHLLLLKRQMCDWREPLGDLSALPPQALTVLTDDPVLQRDSAIATAKARFGGIAPMSPPAWPPHARLRVGYLSSDFHAHATSYLLAELFALHDRAKFEICAYSFGPDDNSEIRQRIKDQVERFADIRALTPPQVAARIRYDEIDVLVDLKGYTRGNKLEILAYHPAHTQIHWLGYPGTLGASFVDGFVADNVTLPIAHEKNFTETIFRLPHSYQINDRQRQIAAPQNRSAYGLPENAFVLASFNQTYKITPEMFSLWCAILRELPESVLWLYESNAYAIENLRQTARSIGLDPARLIFAKPLPLPEHLARYAHVDLAIDTFPVGGHTTTSDALWTATPVVTLIGQSFVSRVAASLLTAAGLAELITSSPEAYKTLILALAQNPARLRQLKRYLRDAQLTLPLFDTPKFVKSWEALLEQMAH
jgi:predicted O-linked N-acetylglucosamine transferase (SPINDLY family)